MEQTEETQALPKASCDDIIAKYRAHYGEQWEGGAATMIARLQQACEEKDLAFLLDWLLPTHNHFMREVFVRITGQPLPRTQRGIQEALATFVGAAGVERYEHALEEQREEKRKKQEQQAHDALLRDLQACRIRSDGQIMTMDVYIQQLIAQGYTRLEPRKRGAATEYILWNDQTRCGAPFRRRREHDYIVSLLPRGQQEDESVRKKESVIGEEKTQ